MFYLLILIGSTFVILGAFSYRVSETKIVKEHSHKEGEDLYLLNERIEYLEKVLLEDFVQFDKEKIEEDEKIESEKSSSLGLEKYKMLVKYEKENYSMDEICTLLNMNNGEVLLLKSLYKNYPN